MFRITASQIPPLATLFFFYLPLYSIISTPTHHSPTPPPHTTIVLKPPAYITCPHHVPTPHTYTTFIHKVHTPPAHTTRRPHTPKSFGRFAHTRRPHHSPTPFGDITRPHQLATSHAQTTRKRHLIKSSLEHHGQIHASILASHSTRRYESITRPLKLLTGIFILFIIRNRNTKELLFV